MEDQNAESQLDALVVCLMYVAIAVLQPVSSPHVSTHSETLHCAGWAESVEAMVHGINMPEGVWESWGCYCNRLHCRCYIGDLPS